MARPSDPRIDAALARVSSDAIWDGDGRWRLALTNGSVALITASVTTGWLRLTSPLPADAVLADDQMPLRLNAALHGAARLVRRIDDRQPHLRADVPLEHDDDLGEAVASACLDLARGRHVVNDGVDGIPASWSVIEAESADLATRAGIFRARVEESEARARVVVDLGDLSGYPLPAMRAVSALLMTLGASVPGLTPSLQQRGSHVTAVCSSPLRARSEAHLARAMTAVSVACEAAGLELRALRADDLSTAYLTRAVPARVAPPQLLSLEEQSCMQP